MLHYTLSDVWLLTVYNLCSGGLWDCKTNHSLYFIKECLVYIVSYFDYYYSYCNVWNSENTSTHDDKSYDVVKWERKQTFHYLTSVDDIRYIPTAPAVLWEKDRPWLINDSTIQQIELCHWIPWRRWLSSAYQKCLF